MFFWCCIGSPGTYQPFKMRTLETLETNFPLMQHHIHKNCNYSYTTAKTKKLQMLHLPAPSNVLVAAVRDQTICLVSRLIIKVFLSGRLRG
jgi:hypothetical protein